MSKPSENTPSDDITVSFNGLSINSSPNTTFFSNTVSGSENTSSRNSSKISVDEQIHFVNELIVDEECGESERISICSVNDCNMIDTDDVGFRRICQSKPHMANDTRWDAIQCIQAKGEELGLGHFRLLKKLGFGDIGNVYLAELKSSGCVFAMKVMDKAMLVGRQKVGRAQTEREILGLLDHPFLPTLYSHFETEKFWCLLMEFGSGGDLHLLRQCQLNKHFSEEAARFYVSEVLLALEYLHVMGVVYRDLKPENVLVREDGHIMLTDFDLSLRCYVKPTLITSIKAPTCNISSFCIEPECNLKPSCFKPYCFKPTIFKPKFRKVKRKPFKNSDSLPVLVAEPTEAKSMSFVGTHEYLAPEIIRGDGHGSAVDWWTFGIFLYELLFGKTPFKGSNNRETLFNIVGEPLKFPEGSVVSFAAKDLIRGLLEKDPEKRLGFKRGATEIKQHLFFLSVNWALVRSISPPEIPEPVDIAEVKRMVDTSMPLNKEGVSDSERTSGLYLDFDFY